MYTNLVSLQVLYYLSLAVSWLISPIIGVVAARIAGNMYRKEGITLDRQSTKPQLFEVFLGFGILAFVVASVLSYWLLPPMRMYLGSEEFLITEGAGFILYTVVFELVLYRIVNNPARKSGMTIRPEDLPDEPMTQEPPFAED